MQALRAMPRRFERLRLTVEAISPGVTARAAMKFFTPLLTRQTA
jgi:hypothetical protein